MGRIHVLPEHVANKIAAGEVVERPASVVKELLENALDAGARTIKVEVEAGGKKLIRVSDDGCGMVRDDAMLAFEAHATSKILRAEDLLNVSTLGFRGEALPSIAAVARVRLETRATEDSAGTVLEINGGKIQTIEEAGLPPGTALTVRDLFFNLPARKKFLKAENTELGHIASLVTHYALAHPAMHFELHSATNAMLVAPPVKSHGDRIYQVFGRETLEQLLPLAAAQPLDRVGLPQPPPWRRDEEYEQPVPGEIRVHGFISKPELQKLNRNSIFIFVNGRLIRDRLVQHALTEAYRNIIPPSVHPVVLLFLELPFTEVDVNVHPSKVEVRFRQSTFVHDFVRESVRAALMKARPVPQFTTEITAQPTAAAALTPGARPANPAGDFRLTAPAPLYTERLAFTQGIEVHGNAAVAAAQLPAQTYVLPERHACGDVMEEPAEPIAPNGLSSLRPLGQIRDSFILAVNGDGLWIIDQHVAHERVLFEKVLRESGSGTVEQQRLLMPLVCELTPSQHAMFAELAEELRRNGFEAEPFGTRTVAVKAAPAGVEPADIERLLQELLEQEEPTEQAINLDALRHRIAASIACHAAIKVNTPLAQHKMEWLLGELSRTACPMACPHGRPVVLRYSLRDIQRAFKRI